MGPSLLEASMVYILRMRDQLAMISCKGLFLPMLMHNLAGIAKSQYSTNICGVFIYSAFWTHQVYFVSALPIQTWFDISQYFRH